MKFVRMRKKWGWEMWGLLGKNARWFLGFSRAVPSVHKKEQPR